MDMKRQQQRVYLWCSLRDDIPFCNEFHVVFCCAFKRQTIQLQSTAAFHIPGRAYCNHVYDGWNYVNYIILFILVFLSLYNIRCLYMATRISSLPFIYILIWQMVLIQSHFNINPLTVALSLLAIQIALLN